MADKDLISLLQIHELDYWTHKFGCTRDQLREAVAAVGDSAKAVGEYLARKAPDAGRDGDSVG